MKCTRGGHLLAPRAPVPVDRALCSSGTVLGAVLEYLPGVGQSEPEQRRLCANETDSAASKGTYAVSVVNGNAEGKLR